MNTSKGERKMKLKKVFIASTILLSSLFLASCGNKKGDAKSGDGKQVITMYRPGNKLKNYDDVMKTVNKEIQKKYPNLELEIKFISWGDYSQKYGVMVTSGQAYDIAIASDYDSNVSKGAYADLTSLIKENAKEAYDIIDPAYWEGITVNDKIYGFPVNANVFSQNTIAFNDTYLKKYNLDVSKVKSYDDLEPIFEEIHKKEPTIATFPIGRPSVSGYEWYVSDSIAIDGSGKTKEVFNPYESAEMMHNLKTIREYYKKGYIPQDLATSQTSYDLNSDTWFAREETNGPFDYGNTALKNASDGKDIQLQPITEAYKTSSDTHMAIYSVSKTSKHAKEAVQILNEINTNPVIANTLIWGVEGKQWEFTDEKANPKRIKTLPDYKSDMFLGAWNTANNRILYVLDSITDEQIKERDESIKNAKKSEALGFSPDLSSVKTEVTNISNVMSKYVTALNCGAVEPEPTVEKMTKDLKVAGWDKVRDLMQEQYDEFLAKKDK